MPSNRNKIMNSTWVREQLFSIPKANLTAINSRLAVLLCFSNQSVGPSEVRQDKLVGLS